MKENKLVLQENKPVGREGTTPTLPRLCRRNIARAEEIIHRGAREIKKTIADLEEAKKVTKATWDIYFTI